MGHTGKIIIDFSALAALYVFVFFKKWRGKGRGVLAVNTLMYVYLALVLYFTAMPVLSSLPHIFSHPYAPMHMTPFEDYLRGRGGAKMQIILNVVMTIPFGFLFPFLWRKHRGMLFLKTLLFTFLLSLSIELLQPLIDRSSDITDIITNTTGGIVGYILYLPFSPFARRLLG
jgi:glycopeptide antibiotics resistance protein